MHSKKDMDAWEKIFAKSLDFYINRKDIEDVTEGSLCYMTFQRYSELNFQSHCPALSYFNQVGSHVFFNL